MAAIRRNDLLCASVEEPWKNSPFDSPNREMWHTRPIDPTVGRGAVMDSTGARRRLSNRLRKIAGGFCLVKPFSQTTLRREPMSLGS
jgi:hypothetical protein